MSKSLPQVGKKQTAKILMPGGTKIRICDLTSKRLRKLQKQMEEDAQRQFLNVPDGFFHQEPSRSDFLPALYHKIVAELERRSRLDAVLRKRGWKSVR